VTKLVVTMMLFQHLHALVFVEVGRPFRQTANLQKWAFASFIILLPKMSFTSQL
jgi:hypothetical protein